MASQEGATSQAQTQQAAEASPSAAPTAPHPSTAATAPVNASPPAPANSNASAAAQRIAAAAAAITSPLRSTYGGDRDTRQKTACERDRKARELLSDSDTESNLSSRPPSDDGHRYPRHRLGGMHSKDGNVVRHDSHSDSLELVREPSPYDIATSRSAAANRPQQAQALAQPVPSSTSTATATPSANEAASATLPAATSAGTAPGPAAAATPTTAPEAAIAAVTPPAPSSATGSKPHSRASSPPPRAMSPKAKAASTLKVSAGKDSLIGLPHGAPTATNAAAAGGAGAGAEGAAASPLAKPEKDNRGMLRRMLSGSDPKASPAGAQSPTRSPAVRPSNGSSPPGSPHQELPSPALDSSLMTAVQNLQLNAGAGSAHGREASGVSGTTAVTTPASSQAPSRNSSVKAPSRAAHASEAKQAPPPPPPAPSSGLGTGGRLTAAALRDMEAKASSKASGKDKEKKKDPDAKSSTSSTLRDKIMGAPMLNRRGSNTSGGNRSDTGSRRGSESGRGGQESASLLKKYGVCEKVAIGKGATAVVRLAHKWDRSTEKLYAVKEFRKRRKNETEKEYVKKLTSEFCISSTLHHINIVETVDLVQDESQHWCEVMEYCPGGDLYAAIKRGGMSQGEVECCFKQLLHGISYLHSMGVAHRDIKPENLLLDAFGHIKITDFGVSDVFRMCWEKSTHYSKGLCGSEPYIAPEQFEHKEYDARLVDVWAAGIVFYCLQFQELPWRVAKMSDPTFKEFVHGYHGSSAPPPLSNLSPRDCRPLLKKMLCPDPKGRFSTEEVLKDAWFQSVVICENGQAPNHKHTIVNSLS